MLFRIHLSVCNGRMRGRDQNQTTSAAVDEPSMDFRALDRNGAARQLPANGSVTMAMRGISRAIVDLGPAFGSQSRAPGCCLVRAVEKAAACENRAELRELTVGAKQRNIDDLA
jgi:hypothetical protein